MPRQPRLERRGLETLWTGGEWSVRDVHVAVGEGLAYTTIATVLDRLHAYLWPDLIILGGGVSKKHEKFLPRLSVNCELVPAELRNEAGIVGAAVAALAATDHKPPLG